MATFYGINYNPHCHVINARLIGKSIYPKLLNQFKLITSVFFMKLFSLLLVSFLLMTSTVSAEVDNVEKLKQTLAEVMPDVKPTKISTTPIEGLYEVIVGSQVVYMSVDARYMIEGDLYDLHTRKNISEIAKSAIRLAALDKLGQDNMLVYKPKKVESTITVVTDIDCPYCRRLHDEVPDYLKNNIQVRYIFMPLKGAVSTQKSISVWCADDQQLALDNAKAGGEVDKKTCDNPVAEHLKLARELGVRGTPAIILEDGKMLSGYIPIDKLLVELGKK